VVWCGVVPLGHLVWIAIRIWSSFLVRLSSRLCVD
jgi:hypothetical protein